MFVNGVEQFQFKAKDSSILANPLCVGSISKDWGAINMTKTGLFGHVYDFNVDYGAVNFLDIAIILNKMPGFNGFIKFSKYNYSEQYFNNYCVVFDIFLQSTMVFILFTIKA